MGNTIYGDISPRTAAFVVKDLMKRGMPYLILEKFGQAKPADDGVETAVDVRVMLG